MEAAAAAPSIFNWEQLLLTHGPLYVIFAIICFFVLYYGPGLIAAHKAMMEQVGSSSVKTSAATERTSQYVERLTESFEDGQKEHRKTQRALEHMADAGRRASESKEVQAHLEMAKTELRSHGT